jgi:peptidoglycan-N-acetylglucosamine deacetylase
MTEHQPDKNFFLTFDGAPNPPGTDNILEVLRKHGVKGTFFMEGRRLEDHSECARRVLASGHDVGNHSYNHPEFDKISLEECLDEVRKTEAILFEKIGIKPVLLRPPAGILTSFVEETFLGLGYTLVLWSYSIKDWEGPDSASIASRVLHQARDNAIVVFHDRIPWIPEALEIIIPTLQRAGYSFKKISESGLQGVIR